MGLGYIGRFAPSPTGPLHAGSLVAALASWLDARAFNQGQGGRWLVRIEDVDAPRCTAGAGEHILAQLATCALLPDAPPLWQSTRAAAYQTALEQLQAAALAYPCACTRKDIAAVHAAQGHAHQRHVEQPYPGTCRSGLHGRTARAERAWRFNTTDFWPKYQSNWPLALYPRALAAIKKDNCPALHRHDRRLGAQQQNVCNTVGDFVLRRADGLWAYQLAVVVDDAAQGITHVVRGEDLADNTPRQILLQQALGATTPRYLHTPLVRGADGEKLSKQHGAAALDLSQPLVALGAAAATLGLPRLPCMADILLPDALALWVNAWRHLYNHPL